MVGNLDMPESHFLFTSHAWYGDMIGGAFRLASEFAQHTSEQRHRVTYVCCNTTLDRPAREDVDGVSIRRYDPPGARCTGLMRLRHHVSATKRLVRQIAEEQRIDAVSGHSPLQFLGAARALRADAAFKCFVVHSPFDDELQTNFAGKRPSLSQQLRLRAANWVDGRNVRSADCVQTLSRYTLDVMGRKYGPAVREKGIVAPGWVDCGNFRPAVDRNTARRELGTDWETDLPVFFTLRRLEARMGLDTLIASAERLVRDGLRFRVLIGGAGALEQVLRSQVRDAGLEDCVRFLGKVNEEHLAQCYAAADCFVLPTKALECFGLIVLEAFAANTPVIAARVAAIPEVAARQGEDWMFEPGNVEELSRTMSRFLTSELNVVADLRSIALEYDRKVVLARWMEILLNGISLKRK